MKYVFKNIKCFIVKDIFFFVLLAITVIGSCFAIHFSYALYQAYMTERKSDLAELYNISLQANYIFEEYDYRSDGTTKLKVPDNKSYLKIYMLKSMIAAMSDEFQKDISEIIVEIVLDNRGMWCHFDVEDGKIVVSEAWKNAIEANNMLTEGRFFTDEEYENGEKVAIAFDKYHWNVGNTPFMDQILIDNDQSVVLAGEKYEVIGWGSIEVDEPTFPITAVPDDTPIIKIGLYFSHPLTIQKYRELKSLAWNELQDFFTVPDIDIPSLDHIYLYNTIILVMALICILAAVNFSIIYRYIMEVRKRDLMVFQICGLTRWKAGIMYFSECLILFVPFYYVGHKLFVFLLPQIQEKYYYMQTVYPDSLYWKLFMIYFGITCVTSLIMVIFSLLKESKLRIRGGERK